MRSTWRRRRKRRRKEMRKDNLCSRKQKKNIAKQTQGTNKQERKNKRIFLLSQEIRRCTE